MLRNGVSSAAGGNVKGQPLRKLGVWFLKKPNLPCPALPGVDPRAVKTYFHSQTKGFYSFISNRQEVETAQMSLERGAFKQTGVWVPWNANQQ